MKSDSGWTVDTLHELVTEHAQNEHSFRMLLQEELDRRVRSQQDQLDRRLNDLRIMLNERFESQREALSAALESAEKAVVKAEQSAEKRFDSVNEFRQQLNDQAATFMTRAEVSARLDNISTEVGRNLELIREVELRLTSRIDTFEGSGQGRQDERSDQRLNISGILQAVAVILTMIGLVIVVLQHKGLFPEVPGCDSEPPIRSTTSGTEVTNTEPTTAFFQQLVDGSDIEDRCIDLERDRSIPFFDLWSMTHNPASRSRDDDRTRIDFEF